MYPLLEKSQRPGLHPERRNSVVPADAESNAHEAVTLWRPPVLEGTELWAVARSARAWTAYHTTFMVCVPRHLDGRQQWRCGTRRYELGSTSTLVLEPGALSVATVEAPGDLDFLLVPPALVQQALAALPPSPMIPGAPPPAMSTALIEDTALVAAFDHLRRSLDTVAPDPAEQQGRLTSYLRALVERAAAATPAPSDDSRCARALSHVRAVITERYAERITLDDLAIETGFSKFYLERSFNDRYGVPIHQFLKRVRVAMALSLMRAGARPSAVARSVGFADQPHMTRVFRDDLGFTPRSYWAASRAGQSQPARRSRKRPPVAVSE